MIKTGSDFKPNTLSTCLIILASLIINFVFNKNMPVSFKELELDVGFYYVTKDVFLE